MELRDVKALVLLMREFGLLELEIEDKKGKVRLVRGSAGDASVDDRPAAPATGRTVARADSHAAAAAKKAEGKRRRRGRDRSEA
jgi:hypothetical protein